jgi:enoyl-CoA hydratase/carnithine racemase
MTEAVADRVAVERSGEVTVIRMSAGENRFNPENLDALEAAFDEVEKSDGGRSPLVFTGEGKFFSNGLDSRSASTRTPSSDCAPEDQRR